MPIYWKRIAEPEKDITPVVVNDPPVRKVITGDKPEADETFQFTFTRDDKSYPMPNGAKEDTLTLTIKGAGTVEVGQITFDKAGTYTYTIKEVNTGIAGYGYDGSVYKIEYEVKEDASSKTLSAERTITKDGKPVKDQEAVSFEFTNSFKAAPHLTVTKTATSIPDNKSAYQAGEKVDYKIVITNDGNVTINDVVLKDDLTGDKWNIGTLTPGKGVTKKTSYTVTSADAAKGSVVNVATATGKGPDPKNPDVPVKEGRVTVPAGPKCKGEVPSKPGCVGPDTIGKYLGYSVSATQKTGTAGDDLKGAPVKPTKTGDENDAMMWILLLLAAMAAAGGAWGVTRKRKKEHK